MSDFVEWKIPPLLLPFKNRLNPPKVVLDRYQPEGNAKRLKNILDISIETIKYIHIHPCVKPHLEGLIRIRNNKLVDYGNIPLIEDIEIDTFSIKRVYPSHGRSKKLLVKQENIVGVNMEDKLETRSTEFSCCGRVFNGQHGLNVHRARTKCLLGNKFVKSPDDLPVVAIRESKAKPVEEPLNNLGMLFNNDKAIILICLQNCWIGNEFEYTVAEKEAAAKAWVNLVK